MRNHLRCSHGICAHDGILLFVQLQNPRRFAQWWHENWSLGRETLEGTHIC